MFHEKNLENKKMETFRKNLETNLNDAQVDNFAK